LTSPLVDAPADAACLTFERGPLRDVRALVARCAEDAGLAPERIADFVLAANEVATNSIVHGGGFGAVRVWHDDAALVCEVADAGHIEDPLAGRRRPSGETIGGRGLWIANRLCDLVQLRSSPSGTIVRLHMWLP
jgi:anti-sigma regulatory factor (Ser/Thr protein kinase)